MIIEIMHYGDFDIAYTLAIFDIGDAELVDLLSKFKSIYKIRGNLWDENIAGVGPRCGIKKIRRPQCFDSVADLFVEYLRKEGLKQIKTKEVFFSDS